MAVRIRRPAAGNAAWVPDSSVALVAWLPIAIFIKVGGADHVWRYIVVGVGAFAALLVLLVELIQSVGRQQLDLLGINRV